MKEFLKTHKHMWWGLYFVIYLACYFLVEAIVPTEGYHIIYSPLDDLIPFCEYFIIFYYIWYLFLGGTALYLMFCDGGAFRRYMWFLILGFSFSLIFYLIYPNGQNLRPDLATLGRENIFTKLLGMIYAADTNTNVCPSMHVIGSFAAMFAVFDCKKLRKWWTYAIAVFLAVMISASTVCCKQHSIVDVFWGIVVSAVLFVVVYVFIKKHVRYFEKQETAHGAPSQDNTVDGIADKKE